MRRVLIVFALLLVIAAAAATLAGLAARRALEPMEPGAPERLFVVAPGETLSVIARNLAREGFVRDARAVEWLARWRGLGGALRAGEYRLSSGATPEALLEKIAAGRIATWEVVIPEGLTLVQIAERLEQAGLADAAGFEAVARDPAVAAELSVEGDTLEGYLFPETYRIPRGLPERAIARLLVAQFFEVWREIQEAAQARDLSMQQVVTLASIVEKETGAPEERPLIAAVFHNRLALGMRLETDPTVIYGIPDFDGDLRRRDLQNPDNPYNTYKIRGLPPGPIANPGAHALRAVVAPADSDYLFFVARGDGTGTHFFSKTYSEHEQAVDRYQRRRGR